MIRVSFDDLFGPTSQSSKNKPERFSELPKRPVPEAPRTENEEPWFVTPEPTNTGSAARRKQITKKIVSIAFPVIGLTILGISIATLIKYVVGIYE